MREDGEEARQQGGRVRGDTAVSAGLEQLLFLEGGSDCVPKHPKGIHNTGKRGGARVGGGGVVEVSLRRGDNEAGSL